MATKNKLISVLSDAEQFALYGLPDFDDGQRLEYLSLSEPELALACSRPSLHAQAYCAVQIGYFKAKHAFFRFTWDEAPEDRAFVLTRYFESPMVTLEAITVYEQYARRAMIADLFGYRLWTADFLAPLCALKNVFALFCSLTLHLKASFHAWQSSAVPRHSALFAVELCTEEQKWAIGLH